ncbi:polysaccharide biosynthesis/export family protein [Aureliella helgolandensis]|uniref:SLBB domain protein n=1 Tax=Aureliella helgolandensis TaxID=2527968 RepID=A0A518GEP1_9BACT|nr:SLBB domain-containing protein [Aureliella helgolandensis]QDV27062.1 SLBB domain protein [Aureliella helgolandensis]
MPHTQPQKNRWNRGWSSVPTLALLTIVVLTIGCRTAASLGLPIAAGANYMLHDVAEIRQNAGHREDVASELAKAPLQPHRVEAGDVLVIEPNDFNSPVQVPSDHTVQQDGTIDLGGYGRMQVVGLSVPDIQQQVQQSVLQQETAKRHAKIGLASHSSQAGREAEEAEDYGVTVRLVSQERGVVYVMGEVNAPGSYPIAGSETVLDALILAGGLSTRSNEHKVILTRPQPSGQERLILPVCYHQILQLGDTATNYQLQPGDRIYVPSLSIWEDIKQSVPWSAQRSCPQCRQY